MMFDTLYKVDFDGVTYTAWHGSPFDRGSADSYYGRPQKPHKGGVGGESGPRIEAQDMTIAEMREYYKGYEYNERFGDKKEW